jgi:hypothetical protein
VLKPFVAVSGASRPTTPSSSITRTTSRSPRPAGTSSGPRSEAPDLRRHGEKEHGPALAEGATAEFDGVALERE